MYTDTFKRLPAKLDLLRVEDKDKIRLGMVTESQIFGTDNNFHPEGLFSIEIFGPVGSEHRKSMFGYIDLKVEILHPLVYHALIKVKALYRQIIEGKVTAIFDNKLKDFVKSTGEGSNTGFTFFMFHLLNIKFERNNSDARNFLIDLLEKAKKENKLTMRYLLVLPAGLRDYTIDPNGKPEEDEINTFYRRILAQSNIISPDTVSKTPDIYDHIYAGIQNSSLELFNYIKSLLDGKNKLVLGKWLSRKIFNSTRNVISTSVNKSKSINDFKRLGYNETLLGLHQFTRSTVPKSTYEIRNKYIRDIFIENSSSAFLTNSKTLKREEVTSTAMAKDYDLWSTSDGIDKIIASLGNLSSRNNVVTLNKGKHYLGLMYTDDKYFKFFQDIDDLPTKFSRDNVHPVTISEFIYSSIYHMNGKFPGFITRYPITGFGSIYPSYIKFTTTTESLVLEELDSNWEPSGSIAYNFPDTNFPYFNTCSVHPSHLAALGGDHDGDTVSTTILLSDEAISEVKSYLGRKIYYINDSGEFSFSNKTDTLEATLTYMTDSPE